MPNCFQLLSKKTGEATRFVEIDEELCKHLGMPVDPVKWVGGWYDWVGWAIAVSGKTLPQLVQEGEADVKRLAGDELEQAEFMLKVVTFLDENYTSDAWAEVGRRN